MKFDSFYWPDHSSTPSFSSVNLQ